MNQPPSLKYKIGKYMTVLFLLSLAAALLYSGAPHVYQDLAGPLEWSVLLPHLGWFSLGLLFLFMAFDYARDSRSYDI